MPDNKSIVIQFQTDVAKKLQGGFVDIAKYLSDDAQWHLPDSLNDFINGAHRLGKDAILDLLETAVKRCYQPETMQFDFHSMMSDKQFVHIHFTLSANTANGKAYKSAYQTLFKVQNEQITEVWEYFDSGLLLQLFANTDEK
jgi:ketosteroid isomerase-like protein